jgi:hypothetical protein
MLARRACLRSSDRLRRRLSVEHDKIEAIIFALAMAVFPFAAQASEAIAYVVDGETFEGYRSAAKGDSKGLPDEQSWKAFSDFLATNLGD